MMGRLMIEEICLQSDVQGLAHAVELSRQGAVDSLRFTGGNLETAFKVDAVCGYHGCTFHLYFLGILIQRVVE